MGPNNSPQLELVCPQTRSKQPQETKAINHNHESTSFKKTNAMAQAKSGTTKASYLPLNYNNSIHAKLMLTTKIMSNIPKSTRVHSWITPR